MAATVDDRVILVEDIKARLMSWDPDAFSQEIDPGLGKLALEELIGEALILNEARKLGTSVSTEEFDRAVEAVKAGYPDQSFQDMIVREYIDYDSWKSRVKNNLLIEKTTEKILEERVRFSNDEWNRYFEAHPGIETEPGQVLVRHITARPCERVRQLVEEIRSGHDFDAVIEKNYGSESEDRPGKPVWVFPELLPDPLKQAILNTPVGRLSDVVETELGCSAFLILDASLPPDPDPKVQMARLRRLYLEEQRQKVFDSWQADMRHRAKISINPTLASRWGLQSDN